MSFYIISVSLGLSIGPSLGGLILSKFPCKYIFFINIPLGIIALITSRLVIPEQTVKRGKGFDYCGTILALVFLMSLLFFINRGPYIGWLSNTSLVLITTAIISFIAFIIVEKKTPEPMLDLNLFSNKIFVCGLICSFLYFAAQLVMTFLAPILLTAASYPSETIGFTVIAFPVAIMFFAPLGGNLSDRLNPNLMSVMAVFCRPVSALAWHTASPILSHVDVIWRMFIFGVGGGFFETSNNVIILGSAPEHRRGIASGISAMVRNTGMVFGVTLSSTLSSLRSEYHRKAMFSAVNEVRDMAVIMGVKDVFILAFIFIIICVSVALLGTLYTNQKKPLSIEKTSMR